MTQETIDHARDAADSMAAQVSGVIERTLAQLGADVGARAVFGEPVTQGGRTVIPVARVVVGIGAGGGRGGSDSDSESSGSGMGAGAGGSTQPLGYIEVTSEEAVFVPLRKPWLDPLLFLAAVPLAIVVTRAFVRLVRG
jgi:uncharacterized spore protein YtfJ